VILRRHLHPILKKLEFRKEVAERIGLGFELPSTNVVVGPNGPKTKSEPVLEMAASV
jgi:hypothetical protein